MSFIHFLMLSNFRVRRRWEVWQPLYTKCYYSNRTADILSVKHYLHHMNPFHTFNRILKLMADQNVWFHICFNVIKKTSLVCLSTLASQLQKTFNFFKKTAEWVTVFVKLWFQSHIFPLFSVRSTAKITVHITPTRNGAARWDEETRFRLV